MIGKTIGQYQVIDKIGEGGMGAVYKAEDTTLHRLVALKTLSGHLTEDEEAQERFIREAQSASSLNHPNITTVHEFIEEGDTRLICMEYIEGKTIRDMVESGVVSVRKAIDIIMQAAEALDAAHNKGILHRDVKSANIMVNMEGRVKVMDFGLAHLEEKSQLTRTGTTMGTLSYSSPEQISGRTVDRRSEIFSLGVVFYELLTGQLPFRAANEAEIVFAIINNEPPKLSKVRDDVPELVETIVSRMLEKDVDLRYQTCGDVISDLKGIRKEMETSTVGITGALERVKASRKKMIVQRLAIGVIAVAIIAGGFLLTTGGPKLDPDRVVVAPFENLTGDESLDDLGNMSGLVLTDGLQRIKEINVVPDRDASYAWQTVQTSAETGELRRSISRAFAEETGAGVLISGAYSLDGDELEFRVQITDSRSGRIVYSLDPIRSPIDNPNDAIEQLSEEVSGYFALGTDERIFESDSPTYSAYRSFNTGMEHYLRFENAAAIPFFNRAFELDSSFIKPLIYQGICHVNLSQWASLDTLLEILDQYRAQVSDYDQLWIDYLHARLTGDYELGYRVMQSAREMAPGSKAVYNFALMANNTHRPEKAIEALEELDPDRGPMKGWYNYWAQLHIAYMMLGQYKNCLRIAERAHTYHPTVLYILGMEIASHALLGNIDEVNSLIDECLNFSYTTEYSPGDVILRAGATLRAAGQSKAAREIFQLAVEWEEARPQQERSTRASRGSLAQSLYFAEKWEEAEALYHALHREFPDAMAYIGYLGLCAARQGDVEGAVHYSDILASTDWAYHRGNHTHYRARIAAALGNRDEAVRLLREAFTDGMSRGIWLHVNYDLLSLRGYQPFEDLHKE